MNSAVQVGYIGLGNMGGPMAMNLAKAGKRPIVLDLKKENIEKVELFGGRGALSLEDMAARCDIIFTCILYDHQVRELFLGHNGLVHLGRPGQVLVIHSTVLPATVRAIESAAAARDMQVVDAPVSGGKKRSEAGTLTIMVGADDSAWERVQPFLKHMGTEIIRVGRAGDAQVIKLGNNIMAMCNQAIVCEALKFVTSLGASKEALLRVANVSTGASWALANEGRFDTYGTEHSMGGTPELPHRLSKDLRYAVSLAQENWTYLPIVSVCAQILPGLLEERLAAAEGLSK